MTKFKNALAALTLTLVLAAAAPAGDMPTGGVSTPPTPRPSPTSSPSSTGDMPTGGLAAEASDDYVDPLAQLWTALLSLF